MNKKDPNRVVTDFVASVDASLADLTDMHAALVGRSRLAKAVTRDAFLRMAIGFEVFRSDWHVAAINRDSSKFVDSQRDRIKQSIAERFAGAKDHVKVEFPTHLSLGEIRAMVDAAGRNVTFASQGKWVDRADRDLAEPYRAAVRNLSTVDFRLIHAVVKTRDCLSHLSQNASNEMNTALDVLQEPELARGAQRVRPSGVPAYLHAWRTAAGARRVEIFHQRLREIAERLVVE